MTGYSFKSIWIDAGVGRSLQELLIFDLKLHYGSINTVSHIEDGERIRHCYVQVALTKLHAKTAK
jgi:hypothetical protein